MIATQLINLMIPGFGWMLLLSRQWLFTTAVESVPSLVVGFLFKREAGEAPRLWGWEVDYVPRRACHTKGNVEAR